ncbi:MAG: ATP synthase F0 subunit B [Acidobacteria bacterium]|nr:ATP synthase F0 subunit B [Acidobacteriota bacterium]MBI3662099.1 ATP synthase F0 subunit B [Acidobacteriota bacterium]
MELLKQIGEFFLQAVPTVILVFLFYLFLRANLFRPLEKVMADRSARIEGARRESEASQAATQEKVRAYQEAQKKARAEVYAEQEAARRKVLEERAALLRETRNRSNDKIRAAKETIAKDLTAARTQIELESQTLGAEVARTILERRPPTSPAARGTQ